VKQETTFAIITVGISIFSLLIASTSVYVAMRNARRQEVGAPQWLRDLREWASEAIDVLSEAAYMCNGMQDVSPDDSRRCIQRLSALVDRGRLFLPNQQVAGYGGDKALAHRGFRHSALDPLVATVSVLKGEVDQQFRDAVIHNRYAVMLELRREFNSNMHSLLDPVHYNKKIARLIRDSNRQVKALYDVSGGQKAVLRRVIARIEAETKSPG
jgi:hypothetical protein